MIKWERRPFTMGGAIEIWVAQGEHVSMNATLAKRTGEWSVSASVQGLMVGHTKLTGSVLDAQVAARKLARGFMDQVRRELD